MQITLWSIVAMSQCAIQGKKSFYATRALLGVLEVLALRQGLEFLLIDYSGRFHS